MASSPVQVANRALARLGLRQLIASFDEASSEASFCRLFYEPAVRETLAQLDWAFASRAALPAPSGIGRAPWAFQFVLPADCIQVREVSALDTGHPLLFAAALGLDGGGGLLRAMWCDHPQPVLRYTANVNDPALWDAEFESAVAWGLAVELALPLTGKSDLLQAMVRGRANSLAQAASNAGQGRPRVAEHFPDSIAVRF